MAPPDRTFAILARLIHSAATYEDIGSDLNVSRARVAQVAAMAWKHGIPLHPLRKRKGKPSRKGRK